MNPDGGASGFGTFRGFVRDGIAREGLSRRKLFESMDSSGSSCEIATRRCNYEIDSSANSQFLSNYFEHEIRSGKDIRNFPYKIAQILKNLPDFDPSHLIAYVDSHSKFVCLLMKGINFNARPEAYMWSLFHSNASVNNSLSIDSDTGISIDNNAYILSGSDGNNSVYQLPLPDSQLDLVTQLFLPIVQKDSVHGMIASALAISAEGRIRYWHRASEPLMTFESMVINMNPSECCMVLSRLPYLGSFILGTSKSRLILLNVKEKGSDIEQRELFQSTGLLHSIAFWRRDLSKDEVRKIFVPPNSNSEVWALTSSSIKCFTVSKDCSEKILMNFDVLKIVCEWFFTNGKIEDFPSPDVQLLDFMVSFDNKACLLVGVSLKDRIDCDAGAREYSFYIFNFCVSESLIGTKKTLTSMKVRAIPLNSTYDQFSIRNFVIESSLMGFMGLDQKVYFRSGNHVAGISLKDEGVGFEYMTPSILMKKTSVLVSAGMIDEKLFFIIPDCGVVMVQMRVSSLGSIQKSQSSMIGEGSSMEDPGRVSMMLLNSFGLYLSGSDEWRVLSDQLFDIGVGGAVMDAILQLTDEIPKNDPRWAEESGEASRSAQILLYQQIKEKKRVHLKFIEFLEVMGLWQLLDVQVKMKFLEYGEKLGSISVLRFLHNMIQSKLAMNDEMKSRRKNTINFFERVIIETLSKRQVTKEQWLLLGLGPQDLFYSAVSEIDLFLDPLCSLLDAYFAREKSSFSAHLKDEFEILFLANQMFEALFTGAINYRIMQSQSRHFGDIISNGLDVGELKFWTWKESYHTLIEGQIVRTRNFIEKLREVDEVSSLNDSDIVFYDNLNANDNLSMDGIWQLTNEGLPFLRKYPCIVDKMSVNVLVVQLYNLSFILLHDMRQKMEYSGKGVVDERFVALRQGLIEPFVERYHVLALGLAEIYHDFKIIIEICINFNYNDKLDCYTRKFSNLGFCKILFEWYKANKYKYELLMLALSEEEEGISELLYADVALEDVAWIHALKMGHFDKSSRILHHLGVEENGSMRKRRAFFGLAKLSRLVELAKDDDDLLVKSHLEALKMRMDEDPLVMKDECSIDEITDIELEIIEWRDKLEELGVLIDRKDIPLSHKDLIYEIIEFAHESQNRNVKMYLFECSLKLYELSMKLRSKSDNRLLLIKIWSESIKEDNWVSLAHKRQNNRIDDCTLNSKIRNSVFYHLGRSNDNSKYLSHDIFEALFENFREREDFAAVKVPLILAYELILENNPNRQDDFLT